MHKLYVIQIRWASKPLNPTTIEQVLNTLGDWVRFSESCWVIWTARNAYDVQYAIMSKLQNDDSLFVAAMAPEGPQGWAPGWFWDWIHDKMHQQLIAESSGDGTSTIPD